MGFDVDCCWGDGWYFFLGISTRVTDVLSGVRSGKDHLGACEASLHPFHQETRRRTECCHQPDFHMLIYVGEFPLLRLLHWGMQFSNQKSTTPFSWREIHMVVPKDTIWRWCQGSMTLTPWFKGPAEVLHWGCCSCMIWLDEGFEMFLNQNPPKIQCCPWLLLLWSNVTAFWII